MAVLRGKKRAPTLSIRRWKSYFYFATTSEQLTAILPSPAFLLTWAHPLSIRCRWCWCSPWCWRWERGPCRPLTTTTTTTTRSNSSPRLWRAASKKFRLRRPPGDCLPSIAADKRAKGFSRPVKMSNWLASHLSSLLIGDWPWSMELRLRKCWMKRTTLASRSRSSANSSWNSARERITPRSEREISSTRQDLKWSPAISRIKSRPSYERNPRLNSISRPLDYWKKRPTSASLNSYAKSTTDPVTRPPSTNWRPLKLKVSSPRLLLYKKTKTKTMILANFQSSSARIKSRAKQQQQQQQQRKIHPLCSRLSLAIESEQQHQQRQQQQFLRRRWKSTQMPRRVLRKKLARRLHPNPHRQPLSRLWLNLWRRRHDSHLAAALQWARPFSLVAHSLPSLLPWPPKVQLYLSPPSSPWQPNWEQQQQQP